MPLKLALLVALAVLTACAPAAHRQPPAPSLLLLPEDQVAKLGAAAYQEIRKSEGLSTDVAFVAAVQRIGARMARASDRPDLAWQFTAINNATPNAFSLPGGLIGIHDGLSALAPSDDELAAVLGHVMAQVTAGHHNERLSAEAIGAVVASLATTSPDVSSATLASALLPFGRQKVEADRIGLLTMANAGFDPRAALTMLKKLSDARGTAPSGYPTYEERIKRLQQLMPQALAIYEASR